MSAIKNKKLSRRDAIKLLGAAAGATVLANVPVKWSKPSIAGGVLPAHAQTSCFTSVEKISFTGDPFDSALFVFTGEGYVFPDTFVESDPGFSSLSYNCQAGCAIFAVACNPAANVSMTALITLANGNQFALEVTSQGKNFWEVLVNLETGEYALDGADSAGTCAWPRNPNRMDNPWRN